MTDRTISVVNTEQLLQAIPVNTRPTAAMFYKPSRVYSLGNINIITRVRLLLVVNNPAINVSIDTILIITLDITCVPFTQLSNLCN